MNNTQLYLTIGIPTMTVILAWLSSRADFQRTNDRMERIEERLNARMDRMDSSLTLKIDAARADARADNHSLLSYMVPLHERMTKLEQGN